MRRLKTFDEFLKLRIVKKQSPDRERAKNLLLESQEKFNFFEKVRDKIGDNGLSPNFVVENCYDILIEILRGKLLYLGYKIDSHEVEISYMRNLGFPELDVLFMNELRYFRNGIKYYGKIFDEEYAEKVLGFMGRVRSKLLEVVEK